MDDNIRYISRYADGTIAWRPQIGREVTEVAMVWKPGDGFSMIYIDEPPVAPGDFWREHLDLAIDKFHRWVAADLGKWIARATDCQLRYYRPHVGGVSIVRISEEAD